MLDAVVVVVVVPAAAAANHRLQVLLWRWFLSGLSGYSSRTKNSGWLKLN
jgi:hypothetical protein